MKLIVGLGNPEQKYDGTRHNVGFRILDAYAESHAAQWQTKEKFKGAVAEFQHDGQKVLLLKPYTFYNLSGESVRALADFYKIAPEDILIIHDELALPFGTVRTRLGGSPAGNNGIKSVNEHLGLTTCRVRIGIWNELRDQIDDAMFVLSKFTKKESEALEDSYKKIASLIDAFLADTFEPTTHS